MVIELNKNTISDHTERYRSAGLSMEFLGEMTKAVSALQAAGYEPYDQLYGYAMHGNDQYITRFGGAREIVTKMDVKDINIFLKHYKDHKWGKYSFVGHIDINCSPSEQTPDVSFEKFVLVTERNGTEINREDITEDVMNYEAHPHGVYWRDEYKMECEAKEGDDVRIYLEATDSLGYLHRMLVHQWREQNGALTEAADASEYIYDSNGVQIFP